MKKEKNKEENLWLMAYVSVDFIAPIQGEPEKWTTYQRSVEGVNKAV